MLKTGLKPRRKARSKPRSRARRRQPLSTRRTTLTLPVELLKKLERLATHRHQTLSAAAACLLKDSLVHHFPETANASSILEMWRKILSTSDRRGTHACGRYHSRRAGNWKRVIDPLSGPCVFDTSARVISVIELPKLNRNGSGPIRGRFPHTYLS